MNYLIDVNVLVAWGWSDHTDHARAARWIGKIARSNADKLFTSAIPQLGFVRVSVQRSLGQITPEMAGKVLVGMLSALGPTHQFIADGTDSLAWPSWCHSAARTTDAHLVMLANQHNATLATLDTAIPGAFVLP